MPTSTHEPLTRDRILAAAITLADADGIDGLTMRRLGSALGVEAMSLYHHLPNKDALLDGLVDRVLSEIPLPGPEVEWRAAIRAQAVATHRILTRHPWAAGLMLSRSVPARMRWMNALLGALRRGGLSAARTDHAYHALDSYIAGFTLWLVGMRIDPATLRDQASAFLRLVPVDELPWVVEHIHEHLKPDDPDDEGSFAFGLDLLLDGLDRARDEV